jgi:hypothetical protein
VKRLLQSALLALMLSGVACAQGYNNGSGYRGSATWSGGGFHGGSAGGGGGGPPIAFVAGTISNPGTGNLTISVNYPAGHAAGQMAYCFLTAFGGNIAALSTTTAPGWTYAFASPTNSVTLNTIIMRRLLDGSEGASVTFTTTVNTLWLAIMRTYTGVNTATPEDGAVGNPAFAANSTGQPSTTTFTTLQNGDMILSYAINWNGVVTLTTPAGFGNPVLDNATANGDSQGSWDMTQASAGPVGTVTSGNITSGNKWNIAVLALRK